MVLLAACSSSGHDAPDASITEPDAPPGAPQCSDGVDNDGDGKIDYPNDPGCVVPNADDETDDCPSGPGCPQCSNGIDDDMTGTIDYPNDPACSSAADDKEYMQNPNACGAGLTIKDVPVIGTDMMTFDMNSKSTVTSPCGGGASALAYAYELHIPKTTVLVATVDDPLTTADIVLDLRSSMCTDPGSEIACHHNTTKSTISRLLAPGIYYLIVEGANSSVTGTYNVHINYLKPEGDTCGTTAECGPGLVCRVPLGQNVMQCAKPMCSDGVDDDGDGKNDFPEDPGCTSASDNDETDDCPSGPNCPECGNGIDDDGDTHTDYPADPTCMSASGTSEACLSHEPVTLVTMPMTSGDTSMATDDSKPSCASSSSTAHAPDLMYRLDLPATTVLHLDVSASWDTVTALYNSTCGGTSVSCSDPPNVTVNNLAAGTYYFLVDGWSSASGAFTLNVSGSIAGGQSCEGALAQSGALTCAAGYTCGGTMGSRTCVPAACHDTIDNDGDGKTDYPADPGCATTSDNDEVDDCPTGPNCPQCSNGIDDDMNGRTDYPADPACAAASSPIERTCPLEQDMFGPITAATTTGTLVGAHDDHDPSCGSDGGLDKQYSLTIPALKVLKIDTENSAVDTLLSLMAATCSEPSIECDDDDGDSSGASLIVRTNIAAGSYVVAVDAYSSSTTPDTFNLHVSGILNDGASCEPADTLGGVFTCDATSSCVGTVGSRHCVINACADGLDNDGDGRIDYPADPGCTDPYDNDESDTCPGPGCPVCSNMIDDDADMKTDYATDPSCWAASGTNEAFCQPETDRTVQIVSPVTTGTTTGMHNDFSQSCQSNTNNDVTLALILPVPVDTLTLDTSGSSMSDTVLSLRDETCGNEVSCDDDSGSGLQSMISVTNLSAGTYSVVVDGYSSNVGGYTLTVHGTVAAGTACTSPLFPAGVLSCPNSCVAGVCQ